MSTNLNTLAIDDPVNNERGVVWNRLHSEREDICEALVKEWAPRYKAEEGTARMSDEDAKRAEGWHRELLQLRLTKVNDALGRLLSGTYGNCRHCGKWIEDPKLEFDPAIAFCIDCWERMQTKH